MCAGVAAVSAGLKATGFKTKVVDLPGRLPNEHRDRLTVKLKIMTMKPRDFKRNYRLDRKTFFHLLSLIRLDIEPSVISAIRAEASSGDSIDPVIQLAITLRILAGGSYLDIAFGYNVGNSTVYPIFWKVMEAINKRLSNIDFPWENEELLREMEGQFNNLSKGAFPGTVLAGDGVVFRRTKPAAEEVDGNVRSFYVRKGFWGHGLQAFVDARCKFREISMRTCSSTHDGTAYKFTGVKKCIDTNLLPKWCNVVLDEAYTCTNQELSPWKGKSLSVEKDAFNYYLSLHRQVVERAFGLLVGRWGIFWRPLRFSTHQIGLVVEVCCKLHNLCIDSFGSKPGSYTVSYLDKNWDRQCGGQPDCHVLWTDDVEVRQGARTDLHTSTGRDILTEHIQRLGLSRPPHSKYSRVQRI